MKTIREITKIKHMFHQFVDGKRKRRPHRRIVTKDSLLEGFFEKDRWQYALEKGTGEKKMNKGDMRLLSDPKVRSDMAVRIVSGDYRIAPPHMQLIPKDTPGEFRTVYINENVDRIFLSILNDLLMEVYADWIHPQCKSYQKGIGCGKVVQELSHHITKWDRGFKADLSKYFDRVPLWAIDEVLDRMEPSQLVDILWEYYHTDLCFDTDGNLIEHYQSLKQGCATASFFADVLLYDIDDKLSKLNGYYVRYSDDICFIGPDYELAMQILVEELAKLELDLNPKKVEYLSKDRYFKFLGFAIRGESITISQGRLKKFQKEIESRTFRKSPIKARNQVVRYLYGGKYSWATSILPIINVEEDIRELDKFVFDCLRATITKKWKVGGLGYVPTQKGGVIQRGTGKNVTANRNKTKTWFDDMYSIGTMRKAMLTSREAYDALAREMEV